MTQPVAGYLPDLSHQVAWAADPNDPIGVPVYADVTAMVREIDQYEEGKQYELDQARVEDSLITFRDPNEYLNPNNTSSPYYPYVVPYRDMISLATWPKGPGSTSNLLNTSNWKVACDPSFESYAVGSLPPFIIQSNTSTGPTVTTTNPQQGTQCLTYTLPTDSSIRYGIVYEVACVPGQQYTASAYVRQTSASTQIIRIADQVLASDPFNRTTASGYGTASSPLAIGGAWTATGGAAGARSTVAATPYSAGYAQTALAVVNTNYWDTLAVAARDVRVRGRVTIPAVATGGEIQAGVVARWSSSGANCYEAVLIFSTTQTVQLRLGKRVATVFTSLATYDLQGVYYQAGDEFFIDFQVIGTALRAAAWRSSSLPADVTVAAQVSATDSSITGTGSAGVFGWLHASNTNSLPVALRWQTVSMVGAVEGTSTSATGSYQRLSVTWTATAPTHQVTLINTAGTATAGTVNIDALMHNTGATAGTWQATGSTVYPIGAPSLERYPRTYEDAGFTGICAATGVDRLAALAAIDLPSDYDYAVALRSPDFYYPLEGGANSTIYPDATGNNNPPLGLNISKFGIGEPPTGGSSMGIPGGGGATGVAFTAPSPASGSTVAATVLGTGPLADAPRAPFVVPASLSGTGGIWRMTVAMWVRASDTGSPQTAFYASKTIGSSAGQAYLPIYMDIDGGVGTALQNVGATGTVHVLTSGDGLSGINLLDGQPHLLVGIVVQDTAGDTFVYRYIDDVLDGFDTATTASLGGALRSQTDSLSVGATDDGARFLAVANGTISRLAVWNRELSGMELTLLYQAGQGNPGETSAERFERHLEQGGYRGPVRVEVSYDSGDYEVGDPIATMQAPSWTGAIDLLTDSQNTTQAEAGTFWPAPDRALCFEGRAERFLRLTPSWTLGEDTAAGEIPYREGIRYDDDPTFVYATVTAGRPGGSTMTGGLAPDVADTRRRYFPRTFGARQDWETDEQAQDYADFVFYSHRSANTRVDTIVIDPASNPTLWPFALGVKIGQRVRVKRRAKAANSGAGITVSLDFFVEKIRRYGMNFSRGTFYVALQLSPIGTAPGPTMQPWILENATYSVLDSTTVLGF